MTPVSPQSRTWLIGRMKDSRPRSGTSIVLVAMKICVWRRMCSPRVLGGLSYLRPSKTHLTTVTRTRRTNLRQRTMLPPSPVLLEAQEFCEDDNDWDMLNAAIWVRKRSTKFSSLSAYFFKNNLNQSFLFFFLTCANSLKLWFACVVHVDWSHNKIYSKNLDWYPN